MPNNMDYLRFSYRFGKCVWLSCVQVFFRAAEFTFHRHYFAVYTICVCRFYRSHIEHNFAALQLKINSSLVSFSFDLQHEKKKKNEKQTPNKTILILVSCPHAMPR